MQVYIGIDWSEEKHDVVFMNERGAAIAQLTIDHSLDGFTRLDATRSKLGFTPQDCLVGLETAHNLIIDFLWSRDYTQVYVLPPNVVRSNQGRYRQSGAKDDPADGFLIADILRTDRGRLQPWHPDSLLTRQIRAKVSLSLHLGRSVVRLSNRLRAVLLRYYPAAVHVFSSLTTQIAPEFVLAYPTPSAAVRLNYEEFKTFALDHGYPHPKKLPACFARLQADHPRASSETVLVYQEEAVELARLLLVTLRTRLTVLADLKELFELHPDAEIFRSLPATRDFLAPALLAKFGDERQRFPKPASVQALAGTCPVTDKSGKRRSVRFRRACDREWRYLCEQWAMALVNSTQHPLAVAYFEQVRPRCRTTHHAYRCLANRWLAIAWRLWQSHTLYDEAYHMRQRALRSKPHT
jgi:transposase